MPTNFDLRNFPTLRFMNSGGGGAATEEIPAPPENLEIV